MKQAFSDFWEMRGELAKASAQEKRGGVVFTDAFTASIIVVACQILGGAGARGTRGCGTIWRED